MHAHMKYIFMSDLFHILLHVSVVHSLSLLYNIPVHIYTMSLLITAYCIGEYSLASSFYLLQF